MAPYPPPPRRTGIPMGHLVQQSIVHDGPILRVRVRVTLRARDGSLGLRVGGMRAGGIGQGGGAGGRGRG